METTEGAVIGRLPVADRGAQVLEGRTHGVALLPHRNRCQQRAV